MLRLIPKLFAAGLFCCCLISIVQAQDEGKALTVALEEGSSQEIVNYLDDRVEISFNNDKRDFSKSQAQIVLRDFFRNHPSKGFQLQQEGKSSATLSYLIGTYRSSEGDFRLLIRGIKRNDKPFLIYSMDFIRH
ncbi:DUF4783 domain-containing protein [Cyclobacterium jeungdonense]|uniref:DUF4783 domain-containing protein n=1 Tax=Cyclobacterium jeungdonense TaxID=708087 RepID=A0ABT8C8H5_9BACT|nr:DUF4783 domain-containing protein [Cyclobacterium jeungdonense]MDN3687991.1 DUF4783 domain-containing protein [Cyclobacterium jeungdonense]